MIDIARELENLVNKTVDPALFPVKKGQSILIGQNTVKPVDTGYAVYKENRELDRFQTKTAAVAYSRLQHRAQHSAAEIHRLDRLIARKITDCVYLKQALQHSDADRKHVVSIQLEDNRLHIKDARDKLEQFIFRRAK